MLRKEAEILCGSGALEHFVKLWDLNVSKMKMLKSYDGSANILYKCAGREVFYLRISFRPDRNAEMIGSEVDFVNFLIKGGVKAARPVKSSSGNYFETYEADGKVLTAVLWTEAKGFQMDKKGFSMPEGATHKHFFTKIGELVGKMHSLSSVYSPPRPVKRFDWLKRHKGSLAWLLPEGKEVLISKITDVIEEISAIKKTNGNFGLCHNDLGIINFTLDYSNPDCDITIFDFDDCGFNYFMYELAGSWEMCSGWTFHLNSAEKRREAMERIYGSILEGYHKFHSPGDAELKMLPLFLKACHIENIIEPYREIYKAGKPLKPNREMKYHEYCLLNDIEYMGLFESIFDPEIPFSM